MAEETDAGEADSITLVTSAFCLWSAGVVALLSEYPLVFFCFNQLLFPCRDVLVQGTSPPPQLHSLPRMLHRCRTHSCFSCRRPCIAAVGVQWFSSLIPALHRGCLLGCGHRSCGAHDSASAVCAG